MSLTAVCFALYVLADIIGSIERKGKEEKRQKSMGAIRNIVRDETITPDDKIKNLKIMFDNNLT